MQKKEKQTRKKNKNKINDFQYPKISFSVDQIICQTNTTKIICQLFDEGKVP